MEACERLATRVSSKQSDIRARADASPAQSLSFSCLTTGVQSTLVKKPVVEKYRRFTGRRGAPNTVKVIEMAKEKARAPNWHVTGAETGKQGK
jgi:hypothetical protein